MNKIILYHGSQNIIDKPQFGLGNPNNDYGLGFYCTKVLDLAKEWACTDEKGGYANKYVLDIDDLSVLSLSSGDYNILNWLSILLENRKFRIGGEVARQAKEYICRHFSVNYTDYDVVKGYRADDSYFAFATAFLNNTISLSQLEKAMFLGELGEQLVIKSKKAFKALEFQEAISVPKEIFYPKKLARDNKAREDFRKEKSNISLVKEKYMIDIMREGWENDDKRLQRIVFR